MKYLLINTKRIMATVCLLILVLSFASCEAPEDIVIASLGEYEKHVFLLREASKIILIMQNIISPLP